MLSSRRNIPSFCRPLLASLLIASAPAQSPAVPQRLTVLRSAYEAAYQKEVAAIHAASLVDLDAKYSAALDRALAAATQAGQLDTAVALRDEKKRVAEKAPLPADDFAAPESLKTLRLTYRSALASLEAKRDQLAAPVKAKYDTALETLQTELTKAGDLDGAIAIRTTREALKNEKAPEMPKVVVEEPGKPTPPAPPPIKPAKEDDPEAVMKLARWAWSAERSIAITTKPGEKPVEVKSEAELPKGKWQLDGIWAGIHHTNAPEVFPWELLPKVPGLAVLAVNQKKPVLPEHVAHMAGLKNLLKFDLSNIAATQAALEALPVMEKLDQFKLGKLEGDVATAVRLIGERMPFLKLLEVGFEIPAEYLPGPKEPLFNLREYSPRGHLNPEIIRKLAAMPKLENFTPKDCRDANLPADLLLPLKHLKVLYLRRFENPTALFPSLAEFENLDYFILSLGSQDKLAPEALAMLEDLKAKKFDLDGGLSKNFGDEHVEALMKIKGVKEMRLLSHRITPEAFEKLKKALPKCKITH